MVRLAVRALVGWSLLTGSACFAQATPTATPQAAAPAAPEKVRCKRYTEIGSLAKVHKECRTEAEWRRYAEAGREGARSMINNPASPGQTQQ